MLKRTRPVDGQTYDHRPDVRYALKYQELLNDWERNYCLSILGFSKLTEKQETKLDIIVEKIVHTKRGDRPHD